MFAQGGALWTPSGQTAATTTRQVAIKITVPTADLDVNGTLRVRGMAGFDTSLTAKLITANAIRVLGLAQLDALLVNGNTQINGMLTVGNFQIHNSNIISSTGNILFGNNNLSTTGNVNAANISALHSTVAMHDSLLTSHQSQLNVHQSEINGHDSAISNIQSINNEQQYEIDTLQNEMLNVQYSMLNVQSAISAHDTAIGALNDTLLNLQSQFSNLNSSQWKNDTLNSGNIYYDGGKVGIGTSSPAAKLDVFGSQRITGNLFVGGELSVSDKFSAQTIVTDTIKPTPTGAAVHVAAPMQAAAIRVDTLLVSDKFTAENSISSDTLVAVKQLDVNHNLSLGSDSGSAESDIASKASVLTIQSDPAKAYNTAINADNTGMVGIGTRYPTEKLSVDGNVSISGNIQSASISTGSILVSDKFTAPRGEFDSLNVLKEFSASARISSDTMFAVKQLDVNHNLSLGSDSGTTESDIASKVANLTIQSDPAATYNVVMSADNNTRVGIGDKNPTEKLSVQGNVKVSGDIVSAGNISANIVKMAKIISSDTITKIIELGDSSLLLDPNMHRIFTKGFTVSSLHGITIGNFRMPNPTGNWWLDLFSNYAQSVNQSASASNSIAIGYNIRTAPSADYAIVVGSGATTGNFSGLQTGYLENDKPNSLMIGFNSSKPTLFVGASDGGETTGNVGIGTTIPATKLTVAGDGSGVANIGGGFCGSNYTGISLNGQSGSCGVYNILSSPTDQTLFINRPSGNSIRFRENNEEQMIIASGGNVGIGTAITNSRLSIKGTTNNSSSSSISIINSVNESLFFVRDDGNIGLGTTCPEEKLSVNGKVRVRYEIFVHEAGNWCDFAFDEDYKRMQYAEKENFYKKHKHLFSVPSAKDIQSGGLPIVAVLKGLTLNTEENSLDIIDLNKRLEILEKENSELKDKIEAIKNKLK